MKKKNDFDSNIDNEFNKVPRGYTVKFKKKFSEQFNKIWSSLKLNDDSSIENKE